MSVFSFNETSDIFESSNGTTVKVHSISSTNLQTFHRNISQLLGAIGEGGSDEFWIPIISALKRFRFDISAMPQSKIYLSENAKTLQSYLSSKVYRCRLSYGSELASILNLLAEQAQQLAEKPESNLLEYLTKIVFENQPSGTAIAICDSRLVPQTQEIIQQLPAMRDCEIVSPANLREAKCYPRMFVIGAPKWFPEFVFSSPRTKQLHIIKHKWISGSWKPQSVLASPYRSYDYPIQALQITDDESNLIYDDPHELIPRIDLKQILDNALEQTVKLMNGDDDIVVAKLFLLENDWAVFLDADDGAAVDLIDLDEEIEKRVRRASIREIQPGIFILLRTEGGGDYIVPVADRLMGHFKEKARADQMHWKTLLRDYVKREGMQKALDDLRNLGSGRATNMNLKHWMSFRGIRTESYDDFLAIMKLIGLEKDATDYWETMGRIRVAHTKAGFTIRAMLLDQVNKSDINALKRYGKMDFELAEQGAGSLAAFRVIEIADETVEVIHWRIGEPFRTMPDISSEQMMPSLE